MTETSAPVWLLDIDGVLNALVNRDTLEHPHWTDLEKKLVSTSHGGQFDLTISATVIAFINAQAALGHDIRWATTWQNDANTFVAPAFGLPQFPVGARALGLSDYYYKERAALLAIDEGRPLVWTDDDAMRLIVKEEIRNSGVPHLLIEPDPTVGLTPADLDAIDAFLRKYA